MSVPKKHHYLPQFYLKGFCPAGDLWVHDRERDASRKLTPKTVAVKKGFYAVRGPEGELDYAEVEGRLGKVESQAAPAIRKLDAGGTLEFGEHYAVVMFAALLKYRTTAFERQSTEFGELFSDPEAAKEMLAPSVEGTRTLLERAGYSGEYLPEMARMVYEHIREHGVGYQPGPNARLEQMLQGTHELGTELMLGPLTVARAPEGSGFITADDPYAVMAAQGAQYPPDIMGQPNLIPPGYEGWIPLSARSLLIAGHEELAGRYISFDEAEVHATNVMMAAQCERFFMGGDETELARVAGELPGKTESGWGLPGRVDLSRHHVPAPEGPS